MGLIKRNMVLDESGIAPIIWGIVLLGSLIAGLGVYQITQRPDVTYNIQDTGFSLAGIGIDSTTLIIILGGVVLLFLWLGMRKKPTSK